jgi:uncharacterized integral membrane protein (TIGR00698 family)
MSSEGLRALIPSKTTKQDENRDHLNKIKSISSGTLLTLVLAIVAGQIAKLPIFSIMGIMIISIILGMIWKLVMKVPVEYSAGITFSSKSLLRLGIMFMGIRLNIQQIVNTGFSVILIDVIVVIFTLVVVIYLGKLTSIDRDLAVLIGVGTAVCGAAAILAVAPLIKAKKEHIALSVACISILGTIGTIIYTFLYPSLGLEPKLYGVLVGSTLHELAHVIAAADPSGEIGSEMAIVIKLGRVALLIPVAFVLGFLYNKTEKEKKKNKKHRLKDLPIPWFIFGFLGFSLINTFVFIPAILIDGIITTSVVLMSMAMAGLGLGINMIEFKKAGFKPVIVGVIGFATLTVLGSFLLTLLSF